MILLSACSMLNQVKELMIFMFLTSNASRLARERFPPEIFQADMFFPPGWCRRTCR
jgi:hypothetical protein